MRVLLAFLFLLLISCSTKPEATAFLDKAAAEPGAIKTASGLVYREIRPGSGPSPRASDVVTVNYRGTLTDGTEFDSSYSRNEPAVFRLNQVISGWTEALQLMPEGSKWKNAWTNELFDGGQTIEVKAPIEQIPFFIRDGAALDLL